MSTRTAIDRALVELANVDEALTLATSAIRARVQTAISVLARARDGHDADAREAIEADAERAGRYWRDHRDTIEDTLDLYRVGAFDASWTDELSELGLDRAATESLWLATFDRAVRS